MESKIIKQEKNPFLEREELTLEIKNEVAPSFDEVKTEIGRDADLTVIKKINTNFGKQIFIAKAVVYDSKEAKEKIETIPQKVRRKMAEDSKAAAEAAKKAEVEAPEAPAEETKEETPTEEPVAEEKTE